MSTTITFYIARHGKTMLNTLDKVQGWCDSFLTPQGIEVAEYLGRGFREIEFESAYSSDLRRTLQTAQTVLRESGQSDLPVTELPEFREACFGKYEADYNTKMWGDAAQKLGYETFDAMYSDLMNDKISNDMLLDAIASMDHMGLAENFAQVEERTQRALYSIAESEARKGRDLNVLVIAHGMSIIALLHNLGGKDVLKGHLDNAAVCKVTYTDGKFTVHTMGDMSFVENGKLQK